jgi:4a-hydroxytetrahydrobiopterin dehydratase
MGADAAQRMLGEVPDWELNETAREISRTFSFKNYYQTISFVNALAWIAHREDHHPELEVGYKRCRVRYSTHAIGGLSDNDFICAAKVSALVEGN